MSVHISRKKYRSIYLLIKYVSTAKTVLQLMQVFTASINQLTSVIRSYAGNGNAVQNVP